MTSVHVDTRRATQFLKVYTNHTMLTLPQCVAHLVMFKILIHLCRSKTQLSPQWQNTQLTFSTVKIQLTSFQNPQILRTISSGRDVINTPAHFLSGVYYDKWWLSYPLRTSVNCTSWLCTWTETRIVQSPTKLNDKL